MCRGSQNARITQTDNYSIEERGMPEVIKADSCRIHITPVGNPNWRILEQHYFTDGQIYLVGAYDYRRKGGRLYASSKKDFIRR
jgi:hypothetical protein